MKSQSFQHLKNLPMTSKNKKVWYNIAINIYGCEQMKTQGIWVIYLTGIAIGFVMTMSFIIGFRLQGEGYLNLGAFMSYLGLLLWPVYVFMTLFFSIKKRKNPDSSKRIQALQRSNLFVPLGAILAIFCIPVIYMIFG